MSDSQSNEPGAQAAEGSQALDDSNLQELLSQNRSLHALMSHNSRAEPSTAREEEVSNEPRSEQNISRMSPANSTNSSVEFQQFLDRERPDLPNPNGEDSWHIGGFLSTNPDDSRSNRTMIKNGELEIIEDFDRRRQDITDTNIDREPPLFSERRDRQPKPFSPRRVKAQYKRSHQNVSGLSESRTQEQMRESGLVPESSAQAARRESASTSLMTNESDPSLAVTESSPQTRNREGTIVKEKPLNIENSDPPMSSFDPQMYTPPAETPRNGDVPSSSLPQADVHHLAVPPSQLPDASSFGTSITGASNEIILPPWQPDSEVEECPICERSFNFFSRKHHCRKCGRVVCNACSPHRITIPYQYIVQPPTGIYDCTESTRTRNRTLSQNSVHDPDIGGGMRVRLCNPCVPDPNPSPHTPLDRPLPPLPPASSPPPQPRTEGSSSRTRVRRSELCPICGDRLPPSNTAIENHIDRCIARHLGEVRLEGPELNTPTPRPQLPRISEQHNSSSSLPTASHTAHHSRRPRHTSEASTLGNFQDTDRDRISPLTQGSSEAAPSRPFLSSRMICFAATKLDTAGEDSECIICMEDFEEGVEMARLECLCKYHKKCIDGWFFQHPGRCPVHGQDNY